MIKPTTNKIQAMLAAVPAKPVNPNSAAISAITKKVTAQPNIAITPFNERSERRTRRIRLLSLGVIIAP
jgi:hypothetical protein